MEDEDHHGDGGHEVHKGNEEEEDGRNFGEGEGSEDDHKIGHNLGRSSRPAVRISRRK